MAKKEHIEYLKHGVDNWNSWRDKNPHIIPDLSKISFRKEESNCPNLSGVNFQEANLYGADLCFLEINHADLRGANLENANLAFAKLRNTELCGANLQNAKLTGIKLIEANLQGANLRSGKLDGVNLSNAILKSTDLEEADLSNAKLCDVIANGSNLCKANLYRADLSRANFKNANFNNASLIKAKLQGSDLREALLMEATLDEADLSKVNLSGTNLSNASLIRAKLQDTSLIKAIFTKTILQRANLEGANLSGANFYQADLSKANLKKAILIGANLNGANLIGANLYEANLSNAGLNKTKLLDKTLTNAKLNKADLNNIDKIKTTSDSGQDLLECPNPNCYGFLNIEVLQINSNYKGTLPKNRRPYCKVCDTSWKFYMNLDKKTIVRPRSYFMRRLLKKQIITVPHGCISSSCNKAGSFELTNWVIIFRGYHGFTYEAKYSCQYCKRKTIISYSGKLENGMPTSLDIPGGRSIEACPQCMKPLSLIRTCNLYHGGTEFENCVQCTYSGHY